MTWLWRMATQATTRAYFPSRILAGPSQKNLTKASSTNEICSELQPSRRRGRRGRAERELWDRYHLSESSRHGKHHPIRPARVPAVPRLQTWVKQSAKLWRKLR